MPKLPFEKLSGAPSYVLGLTLARGVPTPVVDLEALLSGGAAAEEHVRYCVALQEQIGREHAPHALIGVEQVVGVRLIAEQSLQNVPALVRQLPQEILRSVGKLDGKLLLILEALRILPEDWRAA